MQTQYDEDLIEAAVLLAANGRRPGAPPLQVRRFHAERERAYSFTDPDERNACFFRIHLEWFREWGFENQLRRAVDAYPALEGRLSLLAFRKARTAPDEGAELYVNERQRTAVLALRPDRFLSDTPLQGFLRHELMHLHDMVDPAFGYSPNLPLDGQPPSQLPIARRRYRLLWDVTIDGRLSRNGAAAPQSFDQHRLSFDRAFAFWPENRRDAVFTELWQNPQPTHPHIAGIATDPRGRQESHMPIPGGPCPLCGFPTFEWVDSETLPETALVEIARQFPHWRPDHGACRRCAEMYDVAARFEFPPTVVL